MRGKQRRLALPGAVIRIIPAHAGQTRPRLPAGRLTSDHPRACGANVGWVVVVMVFSGSSPRMRGKLSDIDRAAENIRIIPAHAGQTVWTRTARPARPDHPRACGANLFGHLSPPRCLGSSPRMRGKRVLGGWFMWWVPDHPRACGANSTSTHAPSFRIGSSPRMRGKLRSGIPGNRPARIIPAHAGQTS